MPDNNEKVEDFISLWKKKMETEIDKPSAIGETLDRIKEVEKDNEELRKKIADNIELISKTEKIINQTIEENERLKEQVRQGGSGINISELQQKNINLNNKIMNLEKNFAEKEADLRAKSNEITELKNKLDSTLKSVKKDSGSTTAMVEELKSNLAKNKSQIEDLEKKINDLTEENEVLNQQLVEKMKKLPIDYVVPVEQPKSSVIKPQSTKPTTQTLEILCQDLQQDLNKYKRIIEKLNKEKVDLEQTLVSGGYQLEPDEIKELKNENEELKNELSQLQESLKLKQDETALSHQFKEKINILQKQLDEKNTLVTELKTAQQTQPITLKGPMSGLVDDLQNKINKLKMTIEEKNKIIEELKSS